MDFDYHRLISAAGALFMLGIAFAMCRNRRAIQPRVLIWGVAAQWTIGILLISIPGGRGALESVSDVVQKGLDHSFAGSEFVFGPLGAKDGGDSGLGVVFATQVLPTIVFIASLFALLYYFGIMQRIVKVLAWFMVRTMGTSGAESLSVAASIFMGQTEAPLTIRPFLSDLTESELFVVMVAGMASVSGAILGAYVLIGGVPMSHLLLAVAMTAPASLYMAKTMVPETEVPKTGENADAVIPIEDENFLAAVARGASDGLKLAVNVGAMLIAFIALVSLLDALIGLISFDGEPLSLPRLLGWAFSPFAALMGVPWEEAQQVGAVLGKRTILNEILAFGDLKDLAGVISERSYAISTVAITGFANISSIGIMIGGLGALVPDRRDDIARLGVRALIAATITNFSSACVAGALIS